MRDFIAHNTIPIFVLSLISILIAFYLYIQGGRKRQRAFVNFREKSRDVTADLANNAVSMTESVVGLGGSLLESIGLLRKLSQSMVHVSEGLYLEACDEKIIPKSAWSTWVQMVTLMAAQNKNRAAVRALLAKFPQETAPVEHTTDLLLLTLG